ncbi:MAG: sensor histidine kinase [Blastocatellia bacterium]
MSQIDLNKALQDSAKDDPTITTFLGVWPNIESILTAFADATELPLFVYLNDINVYSSPVSSMPPFCREMLNSNQSGRCYEDGARRAKREEPETDKGVQLCHAGMANGRREISIGGIGKLTILFGAKKAVDPDARARRKTLIQLIGNEDRELAERLEQANAADDKVELIADHDSRLMNAISSTIEKLLDATVGFQARATSMAHELSLMMLVVKYETEKLPYLLEDFTAQYPEHSPIVAELAEAGTSVYRQSQLGLYIVRNFLSNASEKTYKKVVRPQFSTISIGKVLTEMVELHKTQAAAKGINFEANGVENLPKIKGSEMELRRLFFNILNNAIKYSYHSTTSAKRYIKIKTKVPYDPGFQERRFAVSIENYGLGLLPNELHEIFKPGFRGKQAQEEVPTGSGIGLSEAVKIMRAHGGKMKFRSEAQHKGVEGMVTYLTTVDLIFPYDSGSFSTKRGTR